MRLSEFEGMRVFDARGRFVGTVARALFDAERPELIGFEVRMRPFLYLLERPRRYISRTGVTLSRAGLKVEKPAKLERIDGHRAGIDWDEVVVWVGMPVAAKKGTEPLGVLKDADIGAHGRVKQILLTRGATSDVAIGTREIDGERVLGFDRGAVRVAVETGSPEFSGGVAASAGKGAARVKVTAERAAVGAVRTAAAAAHAARRSGIGRRAGSSWKGFTEGVRDGMADSEAGAAAGDAPKRSEGDEE